MSTQPPPPPPDASPPTPRPNPVAPASTPSSSGVATLAFGVTAVAALYLGQEVFVPIVLAVLLSFVLAPVADLLRRLRLGRVLSVIAAVALALGVILALGGVIGVQFAQLAAGLPGYQATIERKVGALRESALGRVSDLAREAGERVRQATESASGAPPRPEPSAAGSAADREPMPVQIREPAPTPVQLAQDILGPVVHPLATIGIVLVVAVFLLLQRADLRDRLIRLFGASDLHRTTAALDDAAGRLSRYFLTQLAINAAFGVIIGLGLWAIGVPSPVLWGIVAALMRFVPYVGAFVAAALPIALAAAVDASGWTMALWTLGLFAVCEGVMGHAVEPLLYGHSTGLSPFAVVVSAIFWTWIWGPIGLLLSTPFTVCLVVLGRHVERLEFLDVLLGDRPALTPAENFYQRMLAGDPDEARDHAERLLQERPLSAYYDDVALKGLQLAANDAQRGVMPPEGLERVGATVRSLIDDLADHGDDVPRPGGSAVPDGPVAPMPAGDGERPPPPHPDAAPPGELPPAWRGGTPVLCLAGRGPLDEAAASMLAQLLGKHGLGARVAPHEAASRAGIGRLDVGGVAMVCISYLDISGNPAHLRYLLQRLRQRLPGAPTLVGLWPAGEAVLTDASLRAAIGADHYVSSLREAVAACVAEARRDGGEPAHAPPAGAAPAGG